jgi:hypothetical protein
LEISATRFEELLKQIGKTNKTKAFIFVNPAAQKQGKAQRNEFFARDEKHFIRD